MRAAIAVILCLGIASAQPLNSSTPETGSPRSAPSELDASKIVESGVAATVLSYGRVHPQYESGPYNAPYPTASCHGHAHGYYGNPSHQCKIFHVCQEDGRLETFDCPPYTAFNNHLLVCDWPHKVDHNCDPIYKEEEYHNGPAYPADKSYAPNFLNLYPLLKPVHPSPPYPILPVYPRQPYSPVITYDAKPYVAPEYVSHRVAKLPVYVEKDYATAYPAAPVYEKIAYKSYPERQYPVVNKSYNEYPLEKPAYPVEYPIVKPEYHAEKPIYNAHAYPVEKPSYPASYEKPVYPVEKPAYQVAYEKAVYPIERPAYNPYHVEKPSYNAYPVEKPAYKKQHIYHHEKPVYPVESYPAKPQYPVEQPAYNVYEKPIYPLEKPSYLPAKVIYPERRPSYSAYPVHEKQYPAEVYSVKKALYKPEYEKSYERLPYGPEKSYVLPLFPYNSYAAEQPAYVEKSYAEKPYPYAPYNAYKSYEAKEEKYPTVASYADAMRNYGVDYASRYEPQYGFSSVPYAGYRARLAGLMRNY